MKFSVANFVYELHIAQCPVSPQQIRLRQQLLKKHGKTDTKLFFSCPVLFLLYFRLVLRFNFSILFQIFCLGLQFLISSFGEIHLIELFSGLLICSCSENRPKTFLTRHSSAHQFFIVETTKSQTSKSQCSAGSNNFIPIMGDFSWSAALNVVQFLENLNQ